MSHQRPTIVVAYAARDYPLRATIAEHLYAFRRYADADCLYVNLGIGGVPAHVRRARADMVVLHTSLLSTRWDPELFATVRARAEPLRELGRVRAAMPQDEFIHTTALEELLAELAVTDVFSVAAPGEWANIYPNVDRGRVRFHQVLTGYLDRRAVARIQRIAAQMPARPIDIGYRAWAGAPWLGRHGLIKQQIGDAFARAARARGLAVDISTRDEDTFLADDWYRFLCSCRYTIGVEGGASIIDRDGALKASTERYLAEHPGASFDDVEAACFPGREGSLRLRALSPRHLEACATRTCQILVEGDYNGVLVPGRHYLPLAPDLSNLGDVLDVLGDEPRRQQIVEAAWRDVVASGAVTYERMVQTVLEPLGEISARSPSRRLRAGGLLAVNRVFELWRWARVYEMIRMRGLISGGPRALVGEFVHRLPLGKRLAAVLRG